MGKEREIASYAFSLGQRKEERGGGRGGRLRRDS